MGKFYGFEFSKADQIGGSSDSNVYKGGSDPNQEGGLVMGGLSAAAKNALLSQYGGAVQTRRNRADADKDEEAAIAAAIEESERLSSPSVGKRTPPKPPPPARGSILYKDNDLQRFMKMLELNYNRPGKKTRVHQRLMGWRMHGSKAGTARPTKLSRLIRQGKAFSVLNWKAGHNDLKFPPSAALLRKYYSAMDELGELKSPTPSIADATGANRKRKRKSTKKPLKVKSGKVKKKKGQHKSALNLSNLINDLNLAQDDEQSTSIEPIASVSQTGSGLKSFLVVDMRSVETTIRMGQNMQMCHSLRCKQIDMSTVDQLIFDFSSREFRLIPVAAAHVYARTG